MIHKVQKQNEVLEPEHTGNADKSVSRIGFAPQKACSPANLCVPGLKNIFVKKY